MEEVSESTKKIRERILRDSKEKANKLLEEAKRKTYDIVEEAKKRAEETISVEEKSLREQSAETVKHRITELEVEKTRRIMDFKSEIIEEVFKRALNQLEEYAETSEYITVLKALIIEAGRMLGGGKLTVHINDRDKKLLMPVILEEISRAVQEQSGNETSIKLSAKTSRQIGGAVASTFDGSASVDNTFEARIDRIRESNLLEIETILFE